MNIKRCLIYIIGILTLVAAAIVISEYDNPSARQAARIALLMEAGNRIKIYEECNKAPTEECIALLDQKADSHAEEKMFYLIKDEGLLAVDFSRKMVIFLTKNRDKPTCYIPHRKNKSSSCSSDFTHAIKPI